MTFRSDLYEYLKADVGLSALVGNKIYPMFAADSEVSAPYIVYNVIFSAPVYHMEPVGTNNESVMTRVNIQFDVWGETSESAINIQAAMDAALSGFSGQMNSGTYVRRVFKRGQIDTYEASSDGTNEPEYKIMLDYEFWYNA